MKRLIWCSFLWVHVLGVSACGSSGSTVAGGGTSNQGAGASQSGGTAGSGGSTPAPGGTSNSGGSATEGGASTSGGRMSTGGGSEAGGNGTPGASGGGPTGGSTAAGAAGRPNLPGDVRLVDLDSEQKADLCDWYAEVLGGYGYVAQCGMNPKVFYADQTECVSVGLDFNCDRITVDNLVECVQAQIPSGGCDFPTAQCHWLFCE